MAAGVPGVLSSGSMRLQELSRIDRHSLLVCLEHVVDPALL